MSDPIRLLRKVNLNLIPVLSALLQCQSVTQAANMLNLNQSTVSGDLRQLREIFDDELLTQHGRERHLTEKAKRLAPEVARLTALMSQLFETKTFDPQEAETTFRIATADYVSAMFAVRIGKILRTQAPGISLMLPPTPGASATKLLTGDLDLIVCPNRRANLEACGISEDSDEFRQEVFMRDRLVAIQCAHYHGGAKEPSLDEYLSRPHAIYCRTDEKNTIEQDVLKDLRLHQNNKWYIPYFTILPHLVVDTDIISVIPESLAVQYSSILPIHIFQPPFELPPLELAMLWARSREAFSDVKWLRAIFKEAAALAPLPPFASAAAAGICGSPQVG